MNAESEAKIKTVIFLREMRLIARTLVFCCGCIRNYLYFVLSHIRVERAAAGVKEWLLVWSVVSFWQF
jgi:hypothetical protein